MILFVLLATMKSFVPSNQQSANIFSDPSNSCTSTSKKLDSRFFFYRNNFTCDSDVVLLQLLVLECLTNIRGHLS